MATPRRLSEGVEAFVGAEVARGAAADEAESVAKAVQMYRELKLRHHDLRARVENSAAQHERRETRPLNTQATLTEARRRFSNEGR